MKCQGQLMKECQWLSIKLTHCWESFSTLQCAQLRLCYACSNKQLRAETYYSVLHTSGVLFIQKKLVFWSPPKCRTFRKQYLNHCGLCMSQTSHRQQISPFINPEFIKIVKTGKSRWNAISSFIITNNNQ